MKREQTPFGKYNNKNKQVKVNRWSRLRNNIIIIKKKNGHLIMDMYIEEGGLV